MATINIILTGVLGNNMERRERGGWGRGREREREGAYFLNKM